MLGFSLVRLIVIAILGVAAAPATAQTPRTENILPLATDAAITGWLGSHGTAFSTTATPRNLLFLYLHGQGGTGTGAMELLKTAAENGLHAVGLTYPNDWSPFTLCPSGGDCPENVRREIIEGTDFSPSISVTRANSVENRLIKLIAHLHTLHPSEGWNQFVVNNQIQWDKIVLWGHSQGGGNAGVIARLHTVARCCTSAPAADGGPGSPAAWWATHATPAANYFGFCHTQDQLTTKVAFWNALGTGAFGSVTDVATSTPPYGATHQLSTSVAPAISGQYHNSVVADGVTPRDGNNIPVYKPVWTYMMTAGLSTPAPPNGPTWNDMIFATVPGVSGPVQVKMDVYAATASTGPRPVLVWIHGGGWQSGSHDQTPGFALDLRARGITVASIGYRLSGEAIFPAQIHDCKGAIRYLRANAAMFNIDPQRIGVWGSSAGGHLAALIATSGGVSELEGDTGGNIGFSSSVMVGGAFYPPTDIMAMTADCVAQSPTCGVGHDLPSSPESALLGVNGTGQGLAWLRDNFSNPTPPFPEKSHLATVANPITHIDADDPPMYIAHGDQDVVVPWNQSVRMRDALNTAGVPVIFSLATGFGHGSVGETISDAAAQWIGDVLLGITCPRGTRCQVADIAWDSGEPLPPSGPCATGLTNGGVNEGDYNAFFMGFFDASAHCDIANDDATPRPPFGTAGTNGGVNEGDYNCFFQAFFDGCA